jgi:signal peptidase I
MTLRWFFSRTVRQTADLRKHVWKILNHQRDLLSSKAIEAVETALRDTDAVIRSDADKETLKKQMAKLEEAGNRWLQPYPHAGIRENVEVFLVAVAVAMGIRTFFLQPFKIPTGSMQPTLYGIVIEDLRWDPKARIPNALERFVDYWLYGVSYIHVVAKNDGVLTVGQLKTLLPFVKRQVLYVGGEPHPVWFPPDDLRTRTFLNRHYLLREGQEYRRGDVILKAKVMSGDHLFVDRLTYNFRKPRRGEIIVFATKGIEHPRMPQDQFYIKRLVALGGEHVRLGEDRHLIIDGRRLDASTPHFEKVYSFDPRQPPRESHYSGHSNSPHLAPLFYSDQNGVTVRPKHYMVMGDNTENSFDSRAWGDFPQANVIGKYFFVYWPFLSRVGPSRFGWGLR